MSDTPAFIGRYRIERVLGRGAMGVIYKAHDPEIDRPVAIKLVRSDLLSGEERADYLARFRREAQAAGRCGHPNIVALYDYAMHEGNPFLAMEYVEGISLAQALDRGVRFRPEEAAYIVAQVLEALGCAHALGVVHRDVKPANILLVGGGRVKVTDFGISRIGTSTLTQDGSVVGTPSYMSPEQCIGDAVDARSDLFSAGVVLFEMLTGEKPFPGRSFSVVMKQLLYDDPPDLRGRVPDYLAAAVRKALAKPPAERFQTAAAMAAALRPGKPGAAGVTAPTLAVPAAPPAGSPATGPGATGRAATGMGAATPAGGVTVEQEVLSTLQRRLARHVGPIAKMLVGSAVRKAASLDAFCDLLAANISSEKDRAEFLREARRDCGAAAFRTETQNLTRARASTVGLTRPGETRPGETRPGETRPSKTRPGEARPGETLPAATPQISAAMIDLAVTELTRLIGPIAKVLVKRALATAASPAELWATLAKHIERPADRAAFLRSQPRG